MPFKTNKGKKKKQDLFQRMEAIVHEGGRFFSYPKVRILRVAFSPTSMPKAAPGEKPKTASLERNGATSSRKKDQPWNTGATKGRAAIALAKGEKGTRPVFKTKIG